ncbi:13718_t:CDS:1 [Entrophospora sp. SA101]|nr:13718_t:CDS:1 [Entrophospora sp. SA101]
MRSDAVKLSPTDYDYIMRYKDAKSKPLVMLREKYPISNSRFYRIWKGYEVCTNTWNPSLAKSENNIPVSVVVRDTKKKSKSVLISDPSSDRKKSMKKETIPPVTSQETEDVLELHKRQQKEMEKIRANSRILGSNL